MSNTNNKTIAVYDRNYGTYTRASRATLLRNQIVAREDCEELPMRDGVKITAICRQPRLGRIVIIGYSYYTDYNGNCRGELAWVHGHDDDADIQRVINRAHIGAPLCDR